MIDVLHPDDEYRGSRTTERLLPKTYAINATTPSMIPHRGELRLISVDPRHSYFRRVRLAVQSILLRTQTLRPRELPV